MALSLADFRQRVGRRLGVVPAAGTLSAEDGAVVQEAYQHLYDELSANNLAPWPEETIPGQFADILIGMTAARLVDHFSIAEPRRSQFVALYDFGLPMPSAAERRLRAMTAANETFDSVDMDFF